jgi:V/A-type H+-transporting ATPase subunit F
MFKIGVLGGRETVMGFKALGLDTYPVDDLEEARHVLREITREEEQYAIIYVEENLAEGLQVEIDKFKDVPTPAIILIPGRDGSLGMGLQALNSAVERAVGTNIL